MTERVTRAWQLYEAGIRYNQSLTPDQYRVVETNTEFFAGNQWLNMPDTPAMRRLPKPTFNILERVASLFIASLTSSATAIRVEPLAKHAVNPARFGGHDIAQDKDAAEFANAALANLLEKLKLDYRIRDALYDGAITGDYCAHFWFDPEARPYGGAFENYSGEIQMELVDGINVMFGNPNDRAVESQPYIIIVGRDTVRNLRAEARRHGNAEPSAIQPDSEYDHMPGVGGKVELEDDDETGNGKALYVYLYEMAGGTVHVTKATREAVIYEDIDTGLSVYPIAWGNWRRQKNQYHGRALLTGLIPNQVEINKMFATALRHLQATAFPKVIYDADRVPYWSETVGEPIAVRGLRAGEKIPDLATAFSVPEMSGQISNFLDKLLSYTKDCMGATDAQMGNVKPDNTSALMVLQTNAEIPLENIRTGLHEWVEDIGRILLDMMGTYYGERPVVVEMEMETPAEGPGGTVPYDDVAKQFVTSTEREKVVDFFDFSTFKNLWLNLRVDVGATTYFSEIAVVQTLDNLRRDGMLSAVQYLERVPDKLVPQKDELIRELQASAGAIPPQSGGGAPSMGGPLPPEAGLPVSVQAALERLPSTAKRAARNVGTLRMNH
ncbi:MAG: hypothetical protein IJR48_02840 [Oscillibacter sp.]|nr:hypothetical protein [Oscillibacter sp.]